MDSIALPPTRPVKAVAEEAKPFASDLVGIGSIGKEVEGKVGKYSEFPIYLI